MSLYVQVGGTHCLKLVCTCSIAREYKMSLIQADPYQFLTFLYVGNCHWRSQIIAHIYTDKVQTLILSVYK